MRRTNATILVPAALVAALLAGCTATADAASPGTPTVTIPGSGSAGAGFDLVLVQAKLEPPLRNLAGGGAQNVISTIAGMGLPAGVANGFRRGSAEACGDCPGSDLQR